MSSAGHSLAEFAADILADARRLRDLVAEFESDEEIREEIRAIVNAVDRLHETAAWVVREFAAKADKFEDWDERWLERWLPR